MVFFVPDTLAIGNRLFLQSKYSDYWMHYCVATSLTANVVQGYFVSQTICLLYRALCAAQSAVKATSHLRLIHI